MTGFAYQVLPETAEAGRLGLVVLQTDYTIEGDFRRLLPDSVGLHISRVPSANDLSPDSICAMADALPQAAGLLPPEARFDVVGYGCTSGAAGIGPGRVADLVRGTCHTDHVTDPLTAAIAAFRALGADRIGLVSPYAQAVAAPLRAGMRDAGIAVPAEVSFGENVEVRVSRIDPGSLHAAALEVASQADIDAVFLSCTNLRTLDILADLTATLDLPVLGSNLALAWHMAQIAGQSLAPPWSALLPDRATTA